MTAHVASVCHHPAVRRPASPLSESRHIPSCRGSAAGPLCRVAGHLRLFLPARREQPPEQLLVQAKALGLYAIAITDRNSLAGILRAHGRAKDPRVDMRLVIGCRLDLQDGTSLLAYPTNRPAYARLCQTC